MFMKHLRLTFILDQLGNPSFRIKVWVLNSTEKQGIGSTPWPCHGTSYRRHPRGYPPGPSSQQPSQTPCPGDPDAPLGSCSVFCSNGWKTVPGGEQSHVDNHTQDSGNWRKRVTGSVDDEAGPSQAQAQASITQASLLSASREGPHLPFPSVF